MIVTKIEVTATESVRKILRIHDRMPVEWDPEHRPSDEFIENLILEIQATSEPQGFWILTKSDSLDQPSIEGILWAGIKTVGRNGLGCSIKSLWIEPKYRKQNLSEKLSSACVEWAKSHGATLLVFSTHFTNGRMREVLEKNRCKPGMVDYVLPL